MTTSTAEIRTEHGSRYLQQLCKHWSHRFEVAFDETAGTIRFDADRTLSLAATSDRLAVELTTPDEATDERMRTVVADHLRRFAFREDLAIDWH